MHASSPDADTPPSSGVQIGSLVELLERIGRSDEHVVISSAPRFTKERVARFIHAASPRRTRPFVVFESKAADIEQAWLEATTGTLFIVELCDLSDGDQARLLRALEVRDQASPRATHGSAVRVIAGTSHDFSDASTETRLRSSLFHRLNVMNVRVPASFDVEAPEAAAGTVANPFLTFKEEKTRLLETWEPEYLRQLLYQAGGNLALAARTAGIARAHLYRLLKKHGLAR